MRMNEPMAREVAPALWRDVRYEEPWGRLIVVRGPGFIRLHPMLDRAGNVVPWREQVERWTDGVFEYDAVTHWIRLL